jgi:hypothetical protein
MTRLLRGPALHGRALRRALPLAVLALLLPVTVASAQEDVTPPTISNVTVPPTDTQVDVTEGEASFTVFATITDDLSGVAFAYINFSSPSGVQRATGQFHPIDAEPNAYEAEVTIRQFAESGEWFASSAELTDNAGNFTFVSGGPLEDVTVDVESVSDTDPPVLTALSASPDELDVTNSDDAVTVFATIEDALSGVSDQTHIVLRSPSGQRAAGMFIPTGGDDEYEATVTIPQYAEEGGWVVELVFLMDQAGNLSVLTEDDPTFVDLISGIVIDVTSPSDITAPEMHSLLMAPRALDVTGAAGAVTVTAGLTDDLSGVAHAFTPCPGNMCSGQSQISFRSPSGGQGVGALFEPADDPDTYVAQIELPQFAEAGQWTPTLLLADRVGNMSHLDAEDLSQLGFDATLGVSRTSTVEVLAGEPTPVISQDLLQLSLTSPSGGEVEATITPLDDTQVPGFSLLGQQIVLSAPEESDENPLVLVFGLGAQLFADGENPLLVEVFRNGVLVEDCTGDDGTADPDPCIASRVSDDAGGVVVTVLTSQASTWHFGLPETIPEFAFGGFLGPIAAEATLNDVKGGSSVPVSFSLGGDHGLEVVDDGYPLSRPIACHDDDSVAGPDLPTETPRKAGLTYDSDVDVYTYVWKTPRTVWSGTCRQLVVRFTDGTEATATFRFR